MDPLLIVSLICSTGFALLGNWMARRRGATVLLWTSLGFLFPPLLLILKLIQWTPVGPSAPPDDEEKGV
jgi:hypothetical protein